MIRNFALILISDSTGGKTSPPPGLNPNNPLSALEMTRLALFKLYNQAGAAAAAGVPPPPGLRGNDPNAASPVGLMAEQARALQAVREAEAVSRAAAAAAVAATTEKDGGPVSPMAKRGLDLNRDGRANDLDDDDLGSSPPPFKRERRESSEKTNGSPPSVGGSTNIKISSRGSSIIYQINFKMLI